MANNAQHTPVPLVMTRPRAAAQTFVEGLDPGTRARLSPIYSPLIEIVALDKPIEIAPGDAAIFTSANGVRHAPPGAGRRAFCIGSATTEMATSRGWAAQQTGHDADSLVAHFMQNRPKQRLFHLSGTHTRGAVAQRLTQAGLDVTHIAIYDQHLCPLTPEAAQIIAQAPTVIVPLFSPRTARQFANQITRPTSVHIVALSDAVAAPVRDLAVKSVTVATHPNAQAMGDAIDGLV